MYVNKNLCAECGGMCCKSVPGAAAPEDGGIYPGDKIDRVVPLLESGKWVFETSTIGKKDWFLRPSSKKAPALRVVQMFREYGLVPRECIFLTDSGCYLAEWARPYQCRMLEPKAGRQCVPHGGEDNDKVAAMWRPWWPEITKMMGRRNHDLR